MTEELNKEDKEVMKTKGQVMEEILDEFKKYLREDEELKPLHDKFNYDLIYIVNMMPFVFPSPEISYEDFKGKIESWEIKLSKKKQAKLFPVFKSFLKRFYSI